MKKKEVTLHVPPEAQQDLHEIFTGGYDMPLPRAPRTVLDIGANVGLFSLWAAKVWKDAEIVAYEPWPENADDFDLNMEHEDRVLLHRQAVGSSAGRVAMRGGRNRMCGSLNAATGRAAVVDVVPARELMAAEFIKIDVEGHEMAILYTLDLSSALGVAVEVHPPVAIGAVIEELEGAGLHIFSQEPSVNGCSLVKATRHPVSQEKRQAWRPRAIIETSAPAPVPSPAPGVKLFVGMPVYGGYHPFFVSSLFRFHDDPSSPAHVMKQLPGDSLVARARNTLAYQFLQGDCTHLLFLDTDLMFEPEAIARLVSHGEDIVAGLYPKKQPVLSWVMNPLQDEGPDARGLQKVKYAGTGCLLIKRSVFERMIEAYPDIAYMPCDNEEGGERWDFFSVGPCLDRTINRRRYLSEDWYFCERARELGIPVFMDTHVVLKHVGDAVYPLRDPFEKVSQDEADEGS